MNHTLQAKVIDQIILDIFKLNGLLNTEGDLLTKELGLSSSRWKILGAIALSGKAITVIKISEFMGQSRQAVQQLVNVLISAGLLITMDNPNHKRSKLIALTEKGQKLYKQISEIQAPWANKLSNNIAEQDLLITQKVLQRLLKEILIN